MTWSRLGQVMPKPALSKVQGQTIEKPLTDENADESDQIKAAKAGGQKGKQNFAFADIKIARSRTLGATGKIET